MKSFPHLRPPVRGLFVAATLGVVLVGGWLLAPPSHSQAPAASTPNAALAVGLAKLKTQQADIVANQTKIEAQTALLKEEIREAKIYAGREVPAIGEHGLNRKYLLNNDYEIPIHSSPSLRVSACYLAPQLAISFAARAIG